MGFEGHLAVTFCTPNDHVEASLIVGTLVMHCKSGDVCLTLDYGGTFNTRLLFN